MLNVKNITVSGRIASGATTLAKGLAAELHWEFWEGGEAVARFYKNELAGIAETDVAARPDSHEIWFDEKIKHLLKTKEHLVLQSHLAGFMAHEIAGVFKILVICEDQNGIDKKEVRVDRLVNRKGISVEKAKEEIKLREEGNLAKWQRLYAHSDKSWVYWDKKYYDLVVNTYFLGPYESLDLVLKTLGV